MEIKMVLPNEGKKLFETFDRMMLPLLCEQEIRP